MDDLLEFILGIVCRVVAVPLYVTGELLKVAVHRGDYRFKWWDDRSNYGSLFLGLAFWSVVLGLYLLLF